MSTVTTAITRTLYIFDQGLKGLGGHYYEYVRSIAEAAEAAGFRCVVGCHKQAGKGSFASFPLHPVFRDDVWATIPGEDYHSAGSMTGVSERFLEDVQKLHRFGHRPAVLGWSYRINRLRSSSPAVGETAD